MVKERERIYETIRKVKPWLLNDAAFLVDLKYWFQVERNVNEMKIFNEMVKQEETFKVKKLVQEKRLNPWKEFEFTNEQITELIRSNLTPMTQEDFQEVKSGTGIKMKHDNSEIILKINKIENDYDIYDISINKLNDKSRNYDVKYKHIMKNLHAFEIEGIMYWTDDVRAELLKRILESKFIPWRLM